MSDDQPTQISRKPNPIPNSKPFPPGVSGNPGGRPKTKHITEAYLKVGKLTAAERLTFRPANGFEEIALAQIDRAKGDAVKHGPLDQLVPISPDPNCAREIADRVEGKAAAAQEDREAVTAAAFTPERVAELLLLLGKGKA